MRRFGTRRPKSKKQKLEMAKLRELSLILGGAQYFRKRVNDMACCEVSSRLKDCKTIKIQKCGKATNSRLTHHAYTHLDVHLFQCPECELGHPCRDQVVRHIKDFHNSTVSPIDNRLKYAQDIKDVIRECYPIYFVDAPIPTKTSIEAASLSAGFDLSNHENENDENASDGEEHGDQGEDEEV